MRKRKKKPFAEKRRKHVFLPPIENKWVDLKSVLELLYHQDFYWGVHNDFLDLKYVDLHIDTRDMHCLVKDRHGNVIDIEEMKKKLPEVVIFGMNENETLKSEK